MLIFFARLFWSKERYIARPCKETRWPMPWKALNSTMLSLDQSHSLRWRKHGTVDLMARTLSGKDTYLGLGLRNSKGEAPVPTLNCLPSLWSVLAGCHLCPALVWPLEAVSAGTHWVLDGGHGQGPGPSETSVNSRHKVNLFHMNQHDLQLVQVLFSRNPLPYNTCWFKSLEFSRQEYWSGLPFPPPGNLPDPGIEPISLMSPALPTQDLHHWRQLGIPSYGSQTFLMSELSFSSS